MAALARPRLRPIALPTEHGGWGLLGAPILLGCLLAFGWPTLYLAFAALGAFLTRQPLRLAIGDFRRGKWYPRSRWAVAFASGYGSLCAGGLLLAHLSASHPFWHPLAFAAFVGGIAFSFDLRNRSREVAAELLGAWFLAPFATAMMLAQGHATQAAVLAGVVLGAHATAAILYVRTRLRKTRAEAAPEAPAFLAHLVLLVGLAVLFALQAVGPAIVLVAAALLLRSTWGLSDRRRPVSTAMVGVQEIVYALIVVSGLAHSLPVGG